MKKLLIASIVMLATLTACNNSESVIAPEEQQHQTFAGKTTAREGGYTDEEIKYMHVAMIDLNADYLGNPNSNSRVRILCHTDYTLSVGNACVQVDNYLFNVTWQDAPTLEVGYTGPNTYSYWPRNYQANLVSSCSCK